MPRLIDAEALERKWQYVLDAKADEKGTVAYATFELFIERLQEEPTIDPESLRPHGRWVNVRMLVGGFAEQWGADCPNCGKTSKEPLGNYCSNCGCRLDLEEEDDG